jgi:lysophospholipase L1-like esterase
MSARLLARDGVYPLSLAAGLDPGAKHRIDVVFRSARLGGRWTTSQNRLRIAGLRLSRGGKLLPPGRRPRNAIAFGDSITEGVLAEGMGPFYADLALNNARVTWVSVVCSALQSEFGQLGTGGQGMAKPIEMPPLPQTWGRFDASSSRLNGGMLLPEPDFVFCLMGTNDSKTLGPRLWQAMDIADQYRKWLMAVRSACPHAAIFCITPPLGLHANEIAAAVQDRKNGGDRGTYLIDTSPLRDGFSSLPPGPSPGTYTHVDGATQLAVDGVHPTIYGNAVLGAFIAAAVTRQINH